MLYLASDHAGFQLKKYLEKYFANQSKTDYKDLGPESYVETDDFPDFAIPLAQKVVAEEDAKGILICGSGHGMCIAANKVKGARAIVGYSIEGAKSGRQHNDANILCLASRVLTEDHAAAIVKKFLETEFDGDQRLIRRNKKIEALEKSL
ncbi:MAG: RpiB/LacA/LacB family sugar-phosphate isomerase [Patescibacteria group bacterium]